MKLRTISRRLTAVALASAAAATMSAGAAQSASASTVDPMYLPPPPLAPPAPPAKPVKSSGKAGAKPVKSSGKAASPFSPAILKALANKCAQGNADACAAHDKAAGIETPPAQLDCAQTAEAAGCDPDGHWCYDHPEDPNCAGVTGTYCDEHPDAAECNGDQAQGLAAADNGAADQPVDNGAADQPVDNGAADAGADNDGMDVLDAGGDMGTDGP
jgi:hypothetical protein